MKVKITYTGGASFRGETESGHAVVMDGAAEYGGENKGARPMEMLLLGLGGCTSFDVMLILNKSRMDVRDCVAEIEAERADSTRRQRFSPKYISSSLLPARILIAQKWSAQLSFRKRNIALRRLCWRKPRRSRTSWRSLESTNV